MVSSSAARLFLFFFFSIVLTVAVFVLKKEVKDILHNVVLRNKVRESLHIKKEAFEAWRRVIEVTLASCSVDILPRDTRQTIISEVLQDLLSKVCTPLTAKRRGTYCLWKESA